MDISERVEIVTYLCMDGIVRTRCVNHVARSGDYAPVRWKAPLLKEVEPRRRCNECYVEWFELASTSVPADGNG